MPVSALHEFQAHTNLKTTQLYHKLLKPFNSIITPNWDVRGSKPLNAEIFAADLADVKNGSAPDEYRDASAFRKRSHTTDSMRDILDAIKKKLEDGSGNSFKYIETPFGGGKTHTMIAAYHNAKEMGINPVVIVGTEMSRNDTIWGEIEKQLTGKIKLLDGMASPGIVNLRKVLDCGRPVLILMDEVLRYMIKSATVDVNGTKLSTHAIGFLQELTDCVKKLDKVCIVASFPANSVEYPGDEVSSQVKDDLLREMRRVVARTEHKIVPVSDNDVPDVIRHRLFMHENTNNGELNRAVKTYVDWCEENDLLPPNTGKSQYVAEFTKTYPFTPEVINTLYEQWGTFPTFQRTRGVLKLLALVLHGLRGSERPYVTLADIDLSDSSIRQELIGCVGDHIRGAVKGDITGTTARATNIRYGKECATTVFMKSFSGGGESKGASRADMKRAVAINGSILPSDVTEAMYDLKRRLYYIREESDNYIFTHEANLNSIRADMMENISDEDRQDKEKRLLLKHNGGAVIWPKSSVDIPDNPAIKYVILNDNDIKKVRDMMWSHGKTNRIYKNSVVIICPLESRRFAFIQTLKSMMTNENILDRRSTYGLKKSDVTLLEKELRNNKNDIRNLLFSCYSIIYVPARDGPEEVDLSLDTVTSFDTITTYVQNCLGGDHIHHTIDPDRLHEEVFVNNKNSISTKRIFENMMSAPGSLRPINQDVIRDCIGKGKNFCLGTISDGSISYGDSLDATFNEHEYLFGHSKPESSVKKTTKPDSTKGDTEKPYRGTDRKNDPEVDSTEYDIRIVISTKKTGSLMHLLRQLDNLNFTHSKEITISCTGGKLTNDEYNTIKKISEEIGGRVTPYV